MRRLASAAHWRDLTLPGQFLLAGAIVMIGAMVLVGNWISQRIEDAVVQNSAASAALFMESFVSPLSQELEETDTLSAPARQALAEIFEGTTLGDQVVSYKIWLSGGRIVHASDAALIGRTFEPSEELRRAWSGEVAATFEDLNSLEDKAEAALGVSLLEVYSPIRQVWTGEVIVVAEFYETADQLRTEIKKRTPEQLVDRWQYISGKWFSALLDRAGRWAYDPTTTASIDTTACQDAVDIRAKCNPAPESSGGIITCDDADGTRNPANWVRFARRPGTVSFTCLFAVGWSAERQGGSDPGHDISARGLR
jgi:hypothetical protein